jgi:hypothetical protein
MAFNFSKGRLGRFTLNKGRKLILINVIYAKYKKLCLFFSSITISRGTPSDISRNPRVPWNPGWETLTYTFVFPADRLFGSGRRHWMRFDARVSMEMTRPDRYARSRGLFLTVMSSFVLRYRSIPHTPSATSMRSRFEPVVFRIQSRRDKYYNLVLYKIRQQYVCEFSGGTE